jgi:hypothetical protein
MFVPLDAEKGPQQVQDYRWHALPMDNEMSDIAFRPEFTEIWTPISRTEEVMRVMRRHYEENGKPATGSYSCEHDM